MRVFVTLALVVAGCGSETSLSKPEDGLVEPAPAMVVSPDELSFGMARIGESVLQTFEVANVGDAELEVGSVVLDSGAFTLVDAAFPVVLGAGDALRVEVAFDPGGGSPEGLATVTGSDPLNPSAGVRLLGELGVPRLEIVPEAIDFADVPLFCEELTTVELHSVGSVAVTVDRLLVSGDAYTLTGVPELPLALEPGEVHAVDIAFVPELAGPSDGLLVASSDDPAGDIAAPLSGYGLEDGECVPPEDAELVFDVQYERADVAIILDTSSSMGPTTLALASQFASISSALSSSIPDITWGVATFDDYNTVGFASDRPFRLEQQQTDDLTSVGGVLSSISLAVGGMDWEEASTEALLQAARGAGYDQDCDGAFDVSTDVLPFFPSPLDAFAGTVAGSFDPAVPGTGSQGGMGFRESVFPIFILATDAQMKEPGPLVATPGGCPGDAELYDVIAAINELGGSFIGVEVVGWGASPADQMEAIATATGSFGDLDGDGLTEPTVTRWSGSEIEFRDAIVRAVEALAGAAIFDKVALEVAYDPDGVVLGFTPSEYRTVVAGTEVAFTLTLDGELLLVPEAGASEARFELVADDTLVLAERSIWVR